ncbi:MAG: PadR family transcriptional regulator [Thermoanaerobaculia bacterium]|nr:PadR family transcriptional regulator [Thermoanaerobaculia bacterium]
MSSRARPAPSADKEKKKAAAEMLVLSLLEERQRHGYEIAKLIGERSGGVLDFHAASLYTLLSRLEGRGWIAGRWVEKAGERRRRFYRLTPAGITELAAKRRSWQVFVQAVEQVLVPEPAP